MKHISLAARYRPQTFAEVAGQKFITAVLSRAAAENKAAPAYLLSGTRGVGKTTIARIFAKALNCANAPAAEPCNVCEQCRKITQGVHVDVHEIDGASNNSVDDARQLRETIGYAPMEGRYKVFIVDEAHMLTRHAFNALLKTLEEPPPNVVFVFATTEAHKFPITIISRCQHFIFKHLSEAEIQAHLLKVLKKENIAFEEAAVSLLARRAAGSARDGMSLLDQSLALGGDTLTAASVRNVLGLAGQEVFERLVQGISSMDCAGVAALSREILNHGVDIGFFLRELCGIWRTLFLLLEAGEAIMPTLGLPEDEARRWLELSRGFSSAHVHAAWQITLESQRQIIHSPEPGSALELLLLNLAMLPRLIPIGAMPAPGGSSPAGAPPTGLGGPTSAGMPPAGGSPVSSSRSLPGGEAVFSARPEPALPTKNISEAAPAAEPELEAKEAAPAPDYAPLPRPTGSGGGLDPEGFRAYCASGGRGISAALLSGADFAMENENIVLRFASATLFERVAGFSDKLKKMAGEYSGGKLGLRLIPPEREPKTEAELIAEFEKREELEPLKRIMKARIQRCIPGGHT